MKDINKEPVSSVEWMHRDKLQPNDYNPNHVAPPELELLVVSVLEDGWTQPIVCLPDYTIVDGFHRYTISGYKRLMERYEGMVPVVIVDADPVHRKMSTVRHNRARGVHGISPMAEMVAGMLEDGVSPEEIQERLGMEDEEVMRLANKAGTPIQAGAEFGKAWKPEK